MFPFGIASRGSFKRQIILTFVVGFFVLAVAFIVYQAKSESAYLYRESTYDVTSLAESLAASSRSWVLANDVAGLQEVVHAFEGHPGFRYAMVISASGQVLAHSDATKVGQFLTDEPSLALIKSPPVNKVVIDDASQIDVAVPVMVDQRHVGWVRVGHGRERIVGNLNKIMLNGALFVLLAVILSLFAALLIAKRLGARIGYLMRVAEDVQAGNYASRADISGVDEIAKLANSLNHMLDVLARDEEQLRAASLYTRSLIEASRDPLVTISPEGKITDVNMATEKATGRNRSELIGTDFSDYFTEPDKAQEGYQQVFAQGFVTDYPLALRHRDGHVTDVLYNASVYRDEAGAVLGVFAAARDITELQRAEAARTQLAAIVESSNDAIIGKTTEGIITSWNKGAESIYGYAADEIIGQPITILAPPSRHAEIHELLEKVRKGGTVANHESERFRKDGALIHVALTLSPIRDASGNITGISTIARDITEKRRMEEELHQASVYNRSLIEASLDPLVTISPEGKITDVNRATEKATGRSSPELVGTDFSNYFTEPDKARAGYRQVFAKGFVTDYPLALRHRDGHVTDVLYNASVYRDETGEVLGVFAAARDVTARKSAEEQLRRSEHSLSEAQRIAHLGNWELDLVSNVLIWSDEIYRIFEIDPEKFGASYEAFLNAIHPDDREMVNNAYTESVKSKMPYDIEHRLLMQDGRVKYVNEKCETHYGEEGKPLRSVGTVHDITERKQAEVEIKALNTELEQRVLERTAELAAANKELEAFSYSVSHDLRTPLRAIDGFSRILLDDYNGKLDDEGKRLLNVVRDNTSRMGQLIDDILKFSRTGRLELSFSDIDMEKLAHEVYEELQPSVADGKLQLEIEAIPPARGDRAMMRQIFVNLLTNAIKFSRSRETARIKVGGSIEGDEAIYYVKDNGVGFDMQYADKLFGVFQRLHGVTEFEGTGIGLAIVKRVVTRHGGRVWAEGKVGEGATIYFALPTKEKEHG